jgi:hypothetical protein
MIVKKIDKSLADSVVSNKHYSKRLGIFWEGFGLFKDDKLVGVCCFGQPSAPIQKHAFKDRDFRLYELTRLVVDDGLQNAASFLISQSIKMLKERFCAIISYADSAHGHSGIVYQATNWIYTGATVSHDCLYLVEGVATHPMTLRDKLGITKPAVWAKENNIAKIKPLPKHRYFFFVGSKKQKKQMKSSLSYPQIAAYPKSEKKLYDSGELCYCFCETKVENGDGI